MSAPHAGLGSHHVLTWPALIIMVGCGAATPQERHSGGATTVGVSSEEAPTPVTAHHEEPITPQPEVQPEVQPEAQPEVRPEEPSVEEQPPTAPAGGYPRGIQIQIAALEREASELERVAVLIVECRDAVLRDNTVGACGENRAREQLQMLGRTGMAGADQAVEVHTTLDTWCERVDSGLHARDTTRQQREAIRRLESRLNEAESRARSRRRTILETIESLRPLAGP